MDNSLLSPIHVRFDVQAFNLLVNECGEPIILENAICNDDNSLLSQIVSLTCENSIAFRWFTVILELLHLIEIFMWKSAVK